MRVRAGCPAEAMGSATSRLTAATLLRIQLGSASVHPTPKGSVISLDGLDIGLMCHPARRHLAPSPKVNGDVVAGIDILAPQVGFEPTTLRLTAPEIWFLHAVCGIVIGGYAAREAARFH